MKKSTLAILLLSFGTVCLLGIGGFLVSGWIKNSNILQDDQLAQNTELPSPSPKPTVPPQATPSATEQPVVPTPSVTVIPQASYNPEEHIMPDKLDINSIPVLASMELTRTAEEYHLPAAFMDEIYWDISEVDDTTVSVRYTFEKLCEALHPEHYLETVRLQDGYRVDCDDYWEFNCDGNAYLIVRIGHTMYLIDEGISLDITTAELPAGATSTPASTQEPAASIQEPTQSASTTVSLPTEPFTQMNLITGTTRTDISNYERFTGIFGQYRLDKDIPEPVWSGEYRDIVKPSDYEEHAEWYNYIFAVIDATETFKLEKQRPTIYCELSRDLYYVLDNEIIGVIVYVIGPKSYFYKDVTIYLTDRYYKLNTIYYDPSKYDPIALKLEKF